MTKHTIAPNIHTARDLDTDLDARTLEELIALGEAAALAPNTRKTYRSGWSSWCQWAIARGHSFLPADPKHIQAWLASLVNQKKKITTLRSYLAAVSHHHKSLPDANPAEDPSVRNLLAGLCRIFAAEGITPKQAGALRWEAIKRIIATAEIPRHNQPGGRIESPEQAQRRAEIDIAIIALAHDAALRSSELLALIWNDIEVPFEKGIHLIRIRRSKTDQTGQGAVVPISDLTAKAIALIRPIDANPLDRIFDISPSTLTRRMRAAARAANIDSSKITSHSPRVGMAQDLAAAGISMPGLMQAGRWKTPATAARYTEQLTAADTSAGQYLQTQS